MPKRRPIFEAQFVGEDELAKFALSLFQEPQ